MDHEGVEVGRGGLVGRAKELARLHGATRSGERLVVLTGPPGIGKSALARWFAREAPGEVHVAHLDGRTRADVVFAVARALGIRFVDEPGEAWREIATRLGGATSVLVVDGADAAPEPTTELVRELLLVTPATIVVTSRRSLDLPGELVVAVPPLDEASSSALLSREITRRNPTHALSLATITRASSRLGGHPLALEIVAMRAAKIGAVALDDDALDASLSPAMVARLLEPSFRTLGAEGTEALLALTVFPGTFDISAARAVLGREAASRVEGLVAASLVVARGERFEVVGVVRAEACRRARATEPERLVAWELAHARHFSGLLEARADTRAAFVSLRDDRESFLVAFETLLRHGHARAAARLAVRLDPGLVTLGPAWLHRSILERAWSALEGTRARGELADLAIALARFFAIRGRHERALGVLARVSGGGAFRGGARGGWIAALRAFSLRPRGRHDEALAEGLAAVRSAEARGDLVLECAATQIVGLVALDRGDLERAGHTFERALAVARRCGATRLEGIVLANASLAELRQGRPDAADRLASRARTSLEAAFDRFHLVRVDILDGLVGLARGHLDAAERAFVRAADQAKEHGDRDGETDARSSLVEVALARGDLAGARVALEEARIALRGTDDLEAQRRVARLEAELSGSCAPELVLEEGDRRLRIGTTAIDLGRRVALFRLVTALARHRRSHPGGGLDVPAMLAAGWPGERMRPESGAARVYMAVRRLRALGLAHVLETREEGYRLSPSVEVVFEGSPRLARVPSSRAEARGTRDEC